MVNFIDIIPPNVNNALVAHSMGYFDSDYNKEKEVIRSEEKDIKKQIINSIYGFNQTKGKEMNELTIFNKSDNAPQFFCSLPAETEEDRVALVSAVNDCEKLEDHLNEAFILTDVVLEKVQLENEETGEMRDAMRVVLVGDKGETYGCTSEGVTNCMQRFFNIIGCPPWSGVKVKAVKKRGRGKYDFTTLEIVK